MPDLLPRLRDATLALVAAQLALELAAARIRRGRSRRALERGARAALALAALLLLTGLTARGLAIGFPPLTNKLESFLGFSLAMLGATLLRHRRLARPGRLLLGLTTAAFLGATFAFEEEITYPSPLLYTPWYAAHVPSSFAGYAFFLAAGADGLDRALGRIGPGELASRQAANVRVGLLLFSASMIFGAVWGVVSWGVYFLWDAKILWSLVTWVLFATFAHVPYWPSLGSRSRVALGAVGFAVVLFTYVGTSFMPGSIHSF